MLTYLSLLRRMVDYQQFTELKSASSDYWRESGDLHALPLLALAHAHLGEGDAALNSLAQIKGREAELDPDGRADLAVALILLWRIEEAIELLDAVLAQQPDHPLALARRAWCWLQQGNLETARKMYERSAELGEWRIPVYTSLVRLLLMQSDTVSAQYQLDGAIRRYQEIYSELPETVAEQNRALLRLLQLEVWVASEKFAEAEAWLNQKRETEAEDEWVGLVVGYSTLLANSDHHDQCGDMLREGLRHYPESIELHHQLAELSLIEGHFMQAASTLHKAIRLALKQDKPVVGLWVKLSGACLHRFDGKARHAAKKAVELAEAMTESEAYPAAMIRGLRSQAKCSLAQVECHEQNYEKSESMFRELLTDNPYFLPALQGLGQQQMQCGNIDEAVQLFERVKAIDPGKGYSALINARQFPEDEETLHKIENAARRPSMEGAVKSSMLFQLASAWEKRKAYDKAFALASEANSASRRFLKYSAKEHRNSCARIRAAFCRELYEHRRECGVDSSLPIYVVGMPRSGTTLVEQMLSSHSEIFGAGELGLIPQVIQGLQRWERKVGSGRSYPECVDDLNPYVTKGIAENVLKELQEYQADAKHVVDKLPHNFENIGLIKFLFPNAKVISVRRDPRDIAMSNYFTDYQAKHAGMGFAYDLTDIGEQLADHNMMMHHWNEVFPGEILEVNYEALVDHTEATVRKMLDYIGVEWQEQLLAFNELDRPVKTASVWQVRQPIYKTSKAKWMRYQNYLEPLIRGTNSKIEPDPIINMNRLPEPGLLVDAIALYSEEKLDEAEYKFKQLLHHSPDHATANFMTGLIYLHKGHRADGIALMEKGYEKCPWNRDWRGDLLQAYELTGEIEKAEALKQKRARAFDDEIMGDPGDLDDLDDFEGDEEKTKSPESAGQ